MAVATVVVGDARALPLATGSVHCCVTSPPYYGLRDYGVEGQIGSEPTPQEFVAEMVTVFREVARVLRPDGTLWLNLGDSYASSGGQGAQGATSQRRGRANVDAQRRPGGTRAVGGFKPKDMYGTPWRVAFALQDDGWYLRSDVVWHKTSPMPESVGDRPTKAHEFLFLLAHPDSGGRFYYDTESVTEPVAGTANGRGGGVTPKSAAPGSGIKANSSFEAAIRGLVERRALRDVWSIAGQPVPDAHFATMPEALVKPCILAGAAAKVCGVCAMPWRRILERRDAIDSGAAIGGYPRRQDGGTRERDPNGGGGNRLAVRRFGGQRWESWCEHDNDCGRALVFDPFCGSGTVGVVAVRHGRNFVGVDLNPEYARMARERIGREFEALGTATAETCKGPVQLGLFAPQAGAGR